MRGRLTTYAFASAIAIAVLGLGFAASGALAGGGNGGGEGHTPVTICHKPGTPAEQTLVVDDDSVELTGHLGHGDTIGPCDGGETTPTDTTPTDTTPTETTPTTPTETTPPPHVVTGDASVYCDLPSQTYIVTGTIDGNAADSVTPATIPGTYHGYTNVTVHRGDTDFRTAVFTYGDCHPSTTTSSSTASTLGTTASAAGSSSSTTSSPKAAPKPAAKPKSAPKSAAKPKLTGNPKVDKCKEKKNGLLECQPGGPGTPKIIVVPGQG